MCKTQEHLVIIDGYSFVFRAFYAIPNLTRKSDGMPTGALYGFAKMLLNLRSKFVTTYMVVALDYGSKTFRHDIYPEYKANRKETPPELIAQLSHVRHVLDALNISYIEEKGYEADDIIATLTKQSKDKDMKVTIVSSDKDLMQLIDDQVIMYDDIKSKFIRAQEVEEKFGVAPHLLLDAFALIGDSSDNVPGVPSIGPKTASELINHFGSLEILYENVEHVKQKKRKESLINNKDLAFLSKQLISLDYQVPLANSMSDLKLQELDYQKVITMLSEYEFSSLASGISQLRKDEIPEIVQNLYKTIADIGSAPYATIILDPEYDKDVPLMVGLKIYCNGQSYKINDLQDSLESISALWQQNHVILYDSKKFMTSMYFANIPLDGFVLYDDIRLMEYLLGETSKKPDISSLLFKYGFGQSQIVEFIGHMRKLLVQNAIFDHYENVEKKMLFITHHIEIRGIMLDTDYLKYLSKDLGECLSNTEQEIYAKVGKEFNLSSPKQLSHILFEDLCYSTASLKKNKSGDYPTDIHTLHQLLPLDTIGIITHIIAWRKYSKLQHTYVLPLLEKAVNHKIHTTLDPIGTVTGRMSSHNPNLQNLPVMEEDDQYNIRKAFISSPHHKIISADYSQIELRILSSIASVEKMKEAFLHDMDIHTATAQELFASSTKHYRDIAKMVNFGIVYGIGAFGLAKQLNISQADAKLWIEGFFASYPEIRTYVEQKSREITQGYVKTMFGRKCYLPQEGKANQRAAERFAINAPIQGTNADIIKLAMIEIERKLAHKVQIIMQIHDELLFEVREEDEMEVAKQIKHIMENIVQMDIPLKVNIKVGSNQAELLPLEMTAL